MEPKFIAIKNDKFEMVTPENEEQLVSDGYILYTETEYQAYLDAVAEMSDAEVLVYLEECKAEEYMNFGSRLWIKMKKKVWAINTLNKSKGNLLTSEEMLNLLSLSNTLENCLKTGSYLTAIPVINQLKVSLPLYSSVGDFAISEIEDFMAVA